MKYGYGTAGSADDLLSRVYQITDSAASEIYARYGYLGAGTIASVEHPAVTNGLTLSYDPDGDHSFAGWDRFGRIVDQKWTAGTNATVVDEFTYTYDRNSSRLTRGNALDSAFSENYTYDALDRLVDADRNGTNLQSWNLDQLGNWNSTTRGSTTETHTHNAANEITSIDGSSAYTDSDAAGNMIVMPKAEGSGNTERGQPPLP